MLCLFILFVIAASLMAEHFGHALPENAVCALIIAALLVEIARQLINARKKRKVQKAVDAAVRKEQTKSLAMTSAEKLLLRGVLNLAKRPVHTIMTSRQDVEFIDVRKDPAQLFEDVKSFERSHLIVIDGDADNVLGVLRKDEYLLACLNGGDYTVQKSMLLEPLYVAHTLAVLELLEVFKKYPAPLAIVKDEAGGLDGVVTHLDVLEAITGEFPDRHEPYASTFRENADGSLTVDASVSIYELRNRLMIDYEPDGKFGTLAGLVLHEMKHFPAVGQKLEWRGWLLEIRQMEGRRVSQIRMSKVKKPDTPPTKN